MSRAVWQVFLNLSGRSDNPIVLSGDAINATEVEKLNRDDKFFKSGYNIYQGMLHTYFDEHEKQATLALEVGPDAAQKAFPGSPIVYVDVFMKGLSLYAAANRTSNRKLRKQYKKLGNHYRSKLKLWIENGNPNVQHFESLLDAENDALKGKVMAAKKNYQVAVLLSARSGVTHVAALACERFGEFYLMLGDTEDASYRLQQAITYYREFGANSKVSQLQTKYSNLWPQPNEVLAL